MAKATVVELKDLDDKTPMMNGTIGRHARCDGIIDVEHWNAIRSSSVVQLLNNVAL